MAKFCTYCGKPLPESGVCDCEASAAARAAADAVMQDQPAQPAAENAYVKKTREAVSQSVPFLKEYWHKPMEATRNALRENSMGLAVVMMVLNALVTGLLLNVCFSEISDAIRSTMRKLGGSRVEVEIPFLSTLLMGVAIAAVALALSAVVLYAILRMVKIEAGFQYVIIAVGANSILCTGCLVLALLCALAGWALGVILCLALGGVTWAVVGMLLLTKVFNAPVSGLMQTLCCILFTAVLVVNCWLGAKLVLAAAGKIEIEGDELGDFIEEIQDEMEDMDFEDLLLRLN